MKRLFLTTMTTLIALAQSPIQAQEVNLPNLIEAAQSQQKLYSAAQFKKLWSSVPVCIKDGARYVGANPLFAKAGFEKRDCTLKKVEMFKRMGKTLIYTRLTELPAEFLKAPNSQE